MPPAPVSRAEHAAPVRPTRRSLCRTACTRGRCAPAPPRTARKSAPPRAESVPPETPPQTRITPPPVVRSPVGPSFPRLQIDLLRLVVKRQPHVSQIRRQDARPRPVQRRQLRRQRFHRLHLGLRPQGLDFHRAPRLHYPLIGRRLRKADVART